MLAPKTLLSRVPNREFRRELDYLRARREAVDALIQSLELYLRYTTPTRNKRRKSN
jgi:hypothetical protein